MRQRLRLGAVVAHRAGRRPRHPRSNAGAYLCGAHRLLVHLRQAVRYRREAKHRPAAGLGPGDVRGRQDRHHQAAAERQVPRRRADGRGGREVQPRAPPDDAGLVPQARARRRRQDRGGGPTDGSSPAESSVLAADRPALRSRRHDRVTQSRAGRRRQVRAQSRVRRPVQVRRAHPAGSHRRREVCRLLE